MLYLTMLVQTLCLIAFETGMQKSKCIDTYYLIIYLLHNSTKQWLVSNIHHYQKPDLIWIILKENFQQSPGQNPHQLIEVINALI